MSYNDSFKRLASLQGSDPGFFVLAVHSFIEGVLRATFSVDDPADDRFSSFLDAFRNGLITKKQSYVKGLDVLGLIAKQHQLTNEVRHKFSKADIEDARAATFHLQKFCALAGIPEEDGLRSVLEYLKAWEERRSYAELVKEVGDLGYRFQMEKKSAKEMADRLERLQAFEAEAAQLKAQIQVQDRAIKALEEAKDRKDQKVDELRAERAGLAEELRKVKDKAKAYDDAQAYLQMISRLTILTRTRTEYEKSIIRLTQEQRKVLEQIRLDSDFLVKGAAGTGKTLVLLKAIEKAKGGGEQGSLGLEELTGSVALLTYTRTLVKYDKYIASLMTEDESPGRISTADAFLGERLRELDPMIRVDYKLPETLAARFPAAGLSPRDLAAEVESFLWGNDIGYEDYVVRGIDRTGMKRPLMKEQRAAVWSSAEAMEAAMEADKTYTRNRAALLLHRALAEGRAPGVRKTDFLFIDEAQDLPASVLKALKACCGRCMVLAGDADQSIYQPGFSFRRAGLDLTGHSRILKMNFRNTVQIHEVAERYRNGGLDPDRESQPEAFREGPPPELFQAADEEDLLDLLERRLELFLRDLGYTPENICIMVPHGDALNAVRTRLGEQGLSVSDIRPDGFDFSESGSVRITTLHSAKGLDFPVVLLVLSRFHLKESSLDPATQERMERNLVYVAMTRAMDHLNVFIREDTKTPALLDLEASFQEPSGSQA